MVARAINEVLLISNEEERAVYISVKLVEGAPPDWKPFTTKINLGDNISDLEVAEMVDGIPTELTYSEFLDMFKDLGQGTKLDSVLDLKSKFDEVLNSKKPGVYAYQPVFRIFIPAQ